MKSLNEYLKESLLGDWNDVDPNDHIMEHIKEFLEENYKILDKNSYKNQGSYEIIKSNGGYVVNVDGDVWIKTKRIKSLTNGLFEFGEIDGSFSCIDASILRNLIGGPKKVTNNFDCPRVLTFKSLKGAPEEVGNVFGCSYTGITNLDGFPKKCDSIYLKENKRLTSLKGSPEKVKSFSCSGCTSLKTLEGAPKEVVGGFRNTFNFDCSGCTSLISLEGAPKKVDGYFDCSGCTSLISLDGITLGCERYNVKGCAGEFTKEDVIEKTGIDNIYHIYV